MKKMRTALAVVMLAWTAVGIASARAVGESTGAGRPQVDVKTFLLGEPDDAFPEVLAAVNEQLLSSVQAQIDVTVIGWGDFNTKYPLVLASGQPVDLVYSANWNGFYDLARKGAFMPLDDVVSAVTPMLYESLSDDAIAQSSVDGKLYMIPSPMIESIAHGLVVRGDLRRKYGMGKIDTLEKLGLYLQRVAESESGMIPFNAGRNDVGLYGSLLVVEEGWTWNCFAGGVFAEISDPKNIFAWRLTDEAVRFYRRSKEWADRGSWPRAVLSNQSTGKQTFLNGTGAFFVTNLNDMNDTYRQLSVSHPEWEPEFTVLAGAPHLELTSYSQNGFSVGSSSRIADRALEVLEQLRSDRTTYDLMFYGIRGVHWDLNAAGQLVEAKPGVTYSGESISIWGFRNPDMIRMPADLMPGYQELADQLVNRGAANPYASFGFDGTPVQTEIAAITAVENQYGSPLVMGQVQDVDAAVSELRAELEKAGLPKVLEEARRQAAAFFGW